MASLPYFILDVFTQQPFSGNPLAVFPDAEGLDSRLMQSVARELNLSETVFVGRSSAPDRFAVRIFTPAREMPFAGHPTIGTAILLDELGRISGGQSKSLVLEEGVGDIVVHLQGQPARATLKTAVPPQVEASSLSVAEAATLLCLSQEEIVRPPFVASCGLPFQIIELRDTQALSKAVLNGQLWQRLLAQQSAREIYLFSHVRPGESLRARMFAPAAGIAEDPATGSAASALAGALALQQSGSGEQRLVIEQGIEMGRPSRIDTRVSYHQGEAGQVAVSGEAVVVSKGEWLAGV